MVKSTIVRPWTKQDDERLVAMVLRGEGVPAIMEATNRSDRGVCTRIGKIVTQLVLPQEEYAKCAIYGVEHRFLGAIPRYKRKRWTASEELLLAPVLAGTESVASAGIRLRRTPRGIATHMGKMATRPLVALLQDGDLSCLPPEWGNLNPAFLVNCVKRIYSWV